MQKPLKKHRRGSRCETPSSGDSGLPWQSPEVVFGARNTAVYFALHSLGAKTVLLSLMATVSALPYTLFTLPTGSVADMVDRKKILLG